MSENKAYNVMIPATEAEADLSDLAALAKANTRVSALEKALKQLITEIGKMNICVGEGCSDSGHKKRGEVIQAAEALLAQSGTEKEK